MAEAGTANIRGIDIDKMAKSYEDENLIFKKDVKNMKTSSREIRWYSKSSGFLTASSPATISNVAEGARPFVLETSWTRNTSHVRKYFVESPTITMEDESDSEVQVVLDNLKDLTQAIAYQVDQRIWNVASENQSATNINSVTTTAAWDGTEQNPYKDIVDAKKKIRQNTKRKINNGNLYVSAKGEADLLNWLVTENGTQTTNFSDDKVKNGVLTYIAGLNVKVSENVTPDYALVGDMNAAVSWRSFKPITSRVIKEEGIGKKIRVWEHGEAILERPKFLTLIDNTEA